MSVPFNPCNCAESLYLDSLVSISLPEGWAKMPESERNYAATVMCSHCGRVLKYAMTKEIGRDREGRIIFSS